MLRITAKFNRKGIVVIESVFDDCQWLPSNQTSCWLFLDYKLPWNSAAFECQRLGGYLASDPGYVIGDYLSSGNDRYWFGLRRDEHATWTWSSGEAVGKWCAA